MASEWKEFEFRAFLEEPVRNGIYKRSEFHGRGTKVINMGELFAYPRLRSIEMKRIELTESENERFSVQAGDLLFARRSLVAEGAGKCCIVLEVNEPTTFESSLIRARVDKTKADANFLYYLFSSPVGAYHLDTILRHVAVAGITGKDLMGLRLLAPCPDIQKEIACVLSALDDKIELNRKMTETLEAMARALFKSWFVDFDPVRAKAEGRPTDLPDHITALFSDSFEDSECGEIPQGWTTGSIHHYAALNPESWTRGTYPEIVQYVDLTNTKWGRIESLTEYEKANAPSRAQRVLRPGDTIIGTVRPGNGSYALISEDGLTGSTGFAVLRPRQAAFRELIYLACTARESIEALAHLADGGAYPAIRPDVVSAAKVIIPPPSIVEEFSMRTAPLLDQWAQLARQNSTLTAVRDALLPKLISGEIRLKANSVAVAE